MNISVVVTVKNGNDKNSGEEVARLVEALRRQTVRPDEVVVVRASSEKGQAGTKKYLSRGKTGKNIREGIKIKTILSVGCSRGRGRNIGVRLARNGVIAVTDAGCLPHRDWLERLTAPIQASDAQNGRAFFCAGFYRCIAKNSFERAVAAYLGADWSPRYLPASRSIAFSKSAWAAVGGYPEQSRRGGEDLSFASKLSRFPGIVRYDAPDALVDWRVPKSLGTFFTDMIKHTRGNFEIHYWPHIAKNMTVLARWLLFFIVPGLIPFYLLRPIWKHRRIGAAWYVLPVVQIIADAGVLTGIMLALK